MDLKLLAWGCGGSPLPCPASGCSPMIGACLTHAAAVAGLPRGRAGVVLRHDHDPARAALGRDLARICRARRLALVVAGDGRLAAALKAGVHLRGGRWPGVVRSRKDHHKFRSFDRRATPGGRCTRRARVPLTGLRDTQSTRVCLVWVRYAGAEWRSTCVEPARRCGSLPLAAWTVTTSGGCRRGRAGRLGQ